MASSNEDVIIVIKSIDSKADKAISRRMSKWLKGLMRSLKIRGVHIYHRLKSRFIFTGHVTLKMSYMIKAISRPKYFIGNAHSLKESLSFSLIIPLAYRLYDINLKGSQLIPG